MRGDMAQGLEGEKGEREEGWEGDEVTIQAKEEDGGQPGSHKTKRRKSMSPLSRLHQRFS